MSADSEMFLSEPVLFSSGTALNFCVLNIADSEKIRAHQLWKSADQRWFFHVFLISAEKRQMCETLLFSAEYLWDFKPVEHWIMVANSCQMIYLADSLGRKKYSLLKQQNEQMMPEALQSHPSVCGFYAINAAFHLFKFRQEITGVHDVNVLSFITNYM